MILFIQVHIRGRPFGAPLFGMKPPPFYKGIVKR
jgi:hypothetical protein